MEDLIARVLSGEASEIEQRLLERWRRESPENEHSYRDFVEVWRLSSATEFQGVISSPPSVESIIAEAERRRNAIATVNRRPISRSGIWRWGAAVAAAAVLVLSLGVVVLKHNPTAEYATGLGETSTVTLGDGSVVRLGPDSRLQVWEDHSRSVSLSGTAFFAVATDSTEPFVIRTDAGEAMVLGTRFELRANPDSLRLVVVEGLVALDAEGSRVEVGQGTMSRVLRGAEPETPRDANVWDLLEWSGGLLIFQSTPLSQVLDEVSTHFGIPVFVHDTTLASRTVTAWFEDETLEEVVNTVCQVVGATCSISERNEEPR